MEYNLHRDFNESFSTAFKRYTLTADLLDAVDRYITSQGNQAGVQNLAEVLYNMAYNYTPSIADALLPDIIGYVKHNGNQAGMQKLLSVLKAIIENGVTDRDTADYCYTLTDMFVKQNACQSGLPILYEGESVTFGAYLKGLINTLAS